MATCLVDCSAVAVQAQSVTAAYGGSPASLSFAIPITASVTSRCGFAAAPSGTFNAGAIDRASWSNDFAFTLDCNGPSRIAIVSSNAGLKADLPQPVPGFANLAPYSVAVSIARNGGTTIASCAAAQLAADAGSACPLAGTASATQGLLIPAGSSGLPGSFMRVSAPAYAGSNVLVSGSYTDTLTVTIAPAS